MTGVADVPIYGERRYAMRIWLDPERMAGYRLTTQDVEDAIRRNNLELPAGRIESQQREFSVTSQTELARPAQFSDIVIRTVNGFPVRMRDVARVEESAASDRSRVRLNGRDAISMGVIRQATANPLELSAGVRAMLPTLKADLPADITIDIANDNSLFIDRSVKSVYQTIAEAVAGSSVSSGSDAPFKYAAPAIVNGTMLPFASRTSPPSASSMSSLRLASFGLIIIPPTPFLKYSICVFESVRNNTFSLNL